MAQEDKAPTSAEKGKGKLDDVKNLDGSKPGDDTGNAKDEKTKSNAKEDGAPKEGM